MNSMRANKIASLGGYGFAYINSTTPSTAPAGLRIVCLHVLTEGTFTTAGNPTGNLTAVTLPANFPVYGQFTSITTASTAATAIAYYGREG